MKHLVLAFALWAHTLFWGIGLAWLVAPRRWRCFWPVFAPVAGWALQSSVVWFGTRLGFKGTDAYALWSLVLPAALAGIVLWKARTEAPRQFLRFWPLWLLSLLVLSLLILPIARSSRPLTTISLGSCDAADYAAGARVLKEFAMEDRSGFLGHTEVVQLHSVDNFYDHWLRLNHFSPSALIAHHCSVLGCQPEHLISLFTASLLALSLPLVFWLARSLLRFGPRTSLGLAAFYGLNPLTWYAVYHVAPGQMLAAQAIALITWSGIAWWRGAETTGRDALGHGLLLLHAYSLILGSYNFIVMVCLAPAAAYAALRVLMVRDWQRLLPWLATLFVPLALSMLLFAERARGLAERFLLFTQFDFGWRIPILSPEGWMGMVSDAGLNAHAGLFRWLLSAMLVAAFIFALIYEYRRRSRRVWVVLSLSLPAIAGYLILVVRGMLADTNASYDAYKLLSVFLPGVVLSLALGLLWLGQQGWRRWLACCLVLTCVVLNLAVAFNFIQRMSRPPLRVDSALADIRKVEAMASVQSVNMMIPDFWDRLWANGFLLGKKQYFETYSYEGRRNTALRGEWNLQGGLIHVVAAEPADTVRINTYFSLHRAESAKRVRARFSDGWHDRERLLAARWRWSKGNASIVIEAAKPAGIRLKGTLKARGFDERELQLWMGQTMIHSLRLSPKQERYEIPVFGLNGRTTRLELRSPQKPAHAVPGDSRPLVLCLYSLELQVQP